MSVTLPKKENAMENNGMITLTKAEMLEEWKKRKGFYSGVRSCDVEREDGVDLDGVLQREMDDWYNKMLREAPSEMLPIENIAKDCPATVDARRAVTVDLPARCVRALALRLDCWAADVTQFAAPGSDDAEAQRVDAGRNRASGGCGRSAPLDGIFSRGNRQSVDSQPPGSLPSIRRHLPLPG